MAGGWHSHKTLLWSSSPPAINRNNVELGSMIIEENFPLKNLNTFKIGGSARYFCVAENLEDLKKAVRFAYKHSISFFVIGGGSNTLISDGGYKGLVIKNSIKGVSFEEQKDGTTLVSAGAGENWDDLVQKTVEKELTGLENLSGIPGTVGGAPVQNIGAYGVEVGSSILSVETFNSETMVVEILSVKQCFFGYRDSIFKNPFGKSHIITKVVFSLKKNGKTNIIYRDLKEYFEKKGIKEPSVKEAREAVLLIRLGKFPDLNETGTAGSFFKNPIVSEEFFKKLSKKFLDMPFFPAGEGKIKIPLAWILDKVCNFKGKCFGSVCFYEKQPLVLVNTGGAKAKDIMEVSEKIIALVKEKTGIEIEREVQFLK